MQAKTGNKVKVHYTLRDADGKEVESSRNTQPMEFIIGEGNVIPGFEKGVTGMSKNETKTIRSLLKKLMGLMIKRRFLNFLEKMHQEILIPRSDSLYKCTGQMVKLLL